MKIYNKLVRDKIPEVIAEKGNKFTTHIAGDNEYLQALRDKISEEIQEFYEDPCAQEMADILEVLDALTEYHGIQRAQVEEVKKSKNEKRGKFQKRIILESVDN